jgi:hypothetical protein
MTMSEAAAGIASVDQAPAILKMEIPPSPPTTVSGALSPASVFDVEAEQISCLMCQK